MHAEHRRQHPVADIDQAELFLALLTSEEDSEQIKQKLCSFVLSVLIAEMFAVVKAFCCWSTQPVRLQISSSNHLYRLLIRADRLTPVPKVAIASDY